MPPRGDTAVGSLGGRPVFGLRVGLGPTAVSRTDVLTEIGDRLDEFEPRLSEVGAHLELSLTVVAADLWVAVLLAMAAVTATGYHVTRLDARPLDVTAA